MATYNSVEDLYSGILGRTSDKGGLDYWTQQFGDTIDASEVAQFQAGAKPELAQKVSSIYQDLFGRDAGTGGQNYWTNQVNSGVIGSVSDLTNAISKGASGDDITARNDKADYETAWNQSLSADSPIQYNAETHTWESTPKQPIKPITAQITTPAPATLRTITPEETVSGQLNKLLAEDSVYLQSAKSKAMELANQRGLINTSLAVGSAQRAAIDAATPIAAQDASTYAASGLSAQNANQQTKQTGYEADLNYTSAYNLQTTLKQMDIDLDITKLAQSDREAFASAITPIMQQVQAEISNIERTPDSQMDANAKRIAIQEQQDFLRSSIAPIAQIYGYNLKWNDSSALSDRQTAIDEAGAG